jgi:hypothetical protein
MLPEIKKMNVYKYLNLLGMRVEDKVTGFKGVVTSISFDLYGCIQALLNPGMGKDGKMRDHGWFDVNRLKVISNAPVMQPPDFVIGPAADAKQGPAEKPVFNKP